MWKTKEVQGLRESDGSGICHVEHIGTMQRSLVCVEF